eukprot:231073-Amorphochlora_amoeboformis.AAC.1
MLRLQRRDPRAAGDADLHLSPRLTLARFLAFFVFLFPAFAPPKLQVLKLELEYENNETGNWRLSFLRPTFTFAPDFGGDFDIDFDLDFDLDFDSEPDLDLGSDLDLAPDLHFDSDLPRVGVWVGSGLGLGLGLGLGPGLELGFRLGVQDLAGVKVRAG